MCLCVYTTCTLYLNEDVSNTGLHVLFLAGLLSALQQSVGHEFHHFSTNQLLSQLTVAGQEFHSAQSIHHGVTVHQRIGREKQLHQRS